MARAQRLEEPRSAVLPILFGMIALMAGLMVARSPLYLPFVLIAALLVAGIAFLKTEWAIHLLVLSMLLSPEFTAAGGLGTAGSVEGSKGAVLRLEDVLLVVIGVAWLARMAVHKQLSPLLRNVMNRSIGLYVLVAFLSTLIGIMGGRVHPMLGLAYVFKYMEYFVIFFLALHHISDWKALRRILITSGVTAMIVSINGIFQIPSGRRVSAPFEGEVGEPNTLGGYLVLMMAIFGAMALEAPRRKQRVLLGSCVAVMGIPLLYTLSRSSWMAAAAATVFLLFTTRKKFRLVMVLIVIISCLLAFMPPKVVERFQYTFTSQRTSVSVGDVSLDPSASERLRSWGEVAKDSVKHPFLGFGVTGYHFIDAQYFRILIETGILGLAVFLYLIYSLAKHSLGASRKLHHPLLRGLNAGFLAALGGLLVHGIGANTFIIIRIMEPFWLFAALVIQSPKIDRKLIEARHESD